MRRIVVALFTTAVIATAPTQLSVHATRTPASCSVHLPRTCATDTSKVPVLVAPVCNPSRTHTLGTSVETIATNDGPRTYLLHVPPSYTGSDAVPLVLNFHPMTLTAVFQEAYSGFSTKADAEGFVVVYPQGVATKALDSNHFNAWMAPSPEPNDLAFVDALLDSAETQLCIDERRVFATGMSNGGMMSVRLACSLSSRIAAIAPVAGAYFPPMAPELNASETCSDTAPVPVIAFHGTSDSTVPFAGGPGGLPLPMITFRLPMDLNPPAENVIGDWSAHDGCTGGRTESVVGTEVNLVEYDSCTRGGSVQLYAVLGGGHTWPGAADSTIGYTTHQINATDLVWRFFSAHPLTGPPAVGGVARQPDAAALQPGANARRNRTQAYVLGGVLSGLAAIGASAWRVRRSSRPHPR